MNPSKYLIPVFILLLSNCQQPKEPPITPGHLTLSEQFEEYFQALTGLDQFNGVIYVSKNGSEVIHKAYNLNANRQSSLHVSRESQFDIHSVSKVMVKYLIFKMQEAKEIGLQDNLLHFIPDFPSGEKITIAMLLDHSSGLPRELGDFEGNELDLSMEEIIDEIKQEKLLFEPGTDKQYSNLGYQLLYYIVGKIKETSFEQYLTDELFLPLKMNDSGAHFFTEEKNIKTLAANHEVKEDTIIRINNILENEFKSARIYSTAADLIKMLEAIQMDPVSKSMTEDSLIQQSGGSDGIRAHIYADLKTNTNFVLLCNFDGIPFQQTIRDMINILESKPYDIPKELNRQSVSVKKEILQKYQGTYYFPDMDISLGIEAGQDKLIVFQNGKIAGELSAENDSTFFEDPKAPESFEFKLNDQGEYDVLMGWRGVKVKGIRE